MTAAPRSLGYSGHAIVLETSGHRYDPAAPAKTLASWAPHADGGRGGEGDYFRQSLLPLCPTAPERGSGDGAAAQHATAGGAAQR